MKILSNIVLLALGLGLPVIVMTDEASWFHSAGLHIVAVSVLVVFTVGLVTIISQQARRK